MKRELISIEDLRELEKTNGLLRVMSESMYMKTYEKLTDDLFILENDINGITEHAQELINRRKKEMSVLLSDVYVLSDEDFTEYDGFASFL